jgi:hypothetical protein
VDAPSGCYQLYWNHEGLFWKQLVTFKKSNGKNKKQEKKKQEKKEKSLLFSGKYISRWITETINKNDKENCRYAFIYSGEGFGFYTQNTSKYFISVKEWSKILDVFKDEKEKETRSRRKWDLIGFDCCLFSMLESIYQLRHLTRYILACETYEPFQGFNSLEMAHAFDASSSILKGGIKNKMSTKEIGQEIISSFIKRVNKDKTADPADMVLLKPRATYLNKLRQHLNQLFSLDNSSLQFPLSFYNAESKNEEEKFRIDSLDEDENGYFDLWSVASSVPCSSNENPKKQKLEKSEIKKLLCKIIIDYKQSEKLKQKNGNFLNGISFCGNPTLDKFIKKEHYFDLDYFH